MVRGRPGWEKITGEGGGEKGGTKAPLYYSVLSSEVQWGQRVAFKGMAVAQ